MCGMPIYILLYICILADLKKSAIDLLFFFQNYYYYTYKNE